MNISCVVDSHSKIGEGTFWDERGQVLYWVDIPCGFVHCYDPARGVNERWVVDDPVGCLAVRESGGLVIACRSGFYFFDQRTGERSAIVDPEAALPDNRFNDGTTDLRGRFWAGTMKEEKPAEPVGRFYRLDPDGQVMPWLGDIFTTNGLAFSPDGGVMYFSDSNADVQTIWACDYDLDDGVPRNQRPFFDARAVAGRPDGGTVDSDGCYWMAGVGGWQVVRLTPEGVVDRIVEMPVERPSKPMFGGRDLDVLYVTSLGSSRVPGVDPDQPQAGGLFAVEGLGVTGVPQVRFAG